MRYRTKARRRIRGRVFEAPCAYYCESDCKIFIFSAAEGPELLPLPCVLKFWSIWARSADDGGVGVVEVPCVPCASCVAGESDWRMRALSAGVRGACCCVVVPSLGKDTGTGGKSSDQCVATKKPPKIMRTAPPTIRMRLVAPPSVGPDGEKSSMRKRRRPHRRCTLHYSGAGTRPAPLIHIKWTTNP